MGKKDKDKKQKMKKIRKNKKNIGKKGAVTHIEMILSFVIFIGFVIFVLVILNPFKSRAPTNLVEFAYEKIENELKTNISSISINLLKVPTAPATCFSINAITDLNCETGKIIVRNVNDADVDYSLSDRLLIVYDGNFYTIYCSSELESSGSLSGCQSFSESDYNLGIIKTKEGLSEKGIISFRDEYNTKYQEVKERLQIPANSDFGFIISDLDKNSLFKVEKEIPRGINVVTQNYPVKIIYSNADIKNAVISVSTW